MLADRLRELSRRLQEDDAIECGVNGKSIISASINELE
jgi:hypothetical protein